MPNAPDPSPPSPSSSSDPKPAPTPPSNFRDKPAKGFVEILPGVFRSTKEAE